MRSALAGFFGELGYQVLSAAGADEARRLAQENPSLQLAFLNLTDPQSGDLELAAWLRSFCPATKVIVATNCLWDLSHLAALPGLSLLQQPYSAGDLAVCLEEILGRPGFGDPAAH